MAINKLGISHEKFVRETKRHHILAFRSLYMQDVSRALQRYEQIPGDDQLIDLYRKAMSWKKSRPKETSGTRNNNNIITDLFSALEKEIKPYYAHLNVVSSRNIAKSVVWDYHYYRKKHIVNDADTSEENKKNLKASGMDILAAAIHGHRDKPLTGSNGVMAKRKAANFQTCEYWEEMGRKVADKEDSWMRCAECSALVVHKLRQLGGFKLPLSIIEQGDGKIDGHFWVVAGTIENRTGNPDYGGETFAIDLWGLATDHIDRTELTIGPPAKRPYKMNNNKIRILCSWEADGRRVF